MREAMTRKGLSFRTLGFLVDMDAGYLCRVANGKRRLSRRAALRVARELDIRPRDLLPIIPVARLPYDWARNGDFA